MNDAQLEKLYDTADKVIERYCTDCSFKGKVCQYFFRTVCPFVSKKLRHAITLSRGGVMSDDS